jgi:hypothetical protein
MWRATSGLGDSSVARELLYLFAQWRAERLIA